jgi:hypothetical protein
MTLFFEERLEKFNRNVPHTVVVLGPPRSGTSMLAGMLRMLDIYMGACNERNHEDPCFNKRVGVSSIRKKITENNSKYCVWGWKEPSTHTYFHQITDSIRNPLIIASYRNILGAVASKIKRSGEVSSEGLIKSYTRHYMQIAELIDTLQAPTLYIDHEKALHAPDDVAERLSTLLTGRTLDDRMRSEIRAFCEPGSYKPISLL